LDELAIDSKPSYVVGFFNKTNASILRRGVAKLKASGSKPTFGFVLVTPPT
jgi:hypothetical protein